MSEPERLALVAEFATFSAQTTGIIKKLIDEADIEGLLNMGCPADEYQPEIDLIVERIFRKNREQGISLLDVGYIVRNVFEEMFRKHDCAGEIYENTGEKIFNALKGMNLIHEQPQRAV